MTRARDVANLIGSGNFSSTTFTATAGQTAFTISHTQGFIQVFMNGLLLDETVDYTSNGSAVTLTSGAAAGDEIEVVAYNTFSVGDALNQAAADARYYTQSAADTRYVNTSGDTMTGNLGIGASPSIPLQVEKAGGGNFVASFQNTTSGTPYGVHVKDAASGANGYPLFQVTNSAGSTAHLKVMSGTGHVLMASQPNFRVKGNTGSWQTISSANEQTVLFGDEQWDIGSNFDTSNGRFTAPVAGKYLFHFHAYVRQSSQNDGSDYGTSRIYKNGSLYSGSTNIFGYQNLGDSDQIAPLTTIMDMSANDYATCVVRANSGSTEFYQPNCLFMGYLIG